MKADEIIIEPVLTEKANILRENEQRTYVFKVHKKANKIMVAEAIELLFKVRALKCRIMNVKGKSRNNYAISRSSFKRGKGKSSSWKKALVTIQSGQNIPIFEGT